MSAWYDAKTKQEIVSIKMFEKFEVSVALSLSCFYLKINKTVTWSRDLTWYYSYSYFKKLKKKFKQW